MTKGSRRVIWRILGTAGLAACAIALFAGAQPRAEVAVSNTPVAPAMAPQGVYVGKIGGLDTWRVPGEPDLVFRAADGQTVIVGRALTADGRDLTDLYATAPAADPELASGPDVQHTPPASPPPASPAPAAAGVEDQLARFLAEAKARRLWFSVGRPGAPVVYAVVDPTCHYCAQAMGVLRSTVEGGQLQLRVILAPFREPLATQLSYAIMKAETPAVAYWEHEITQSQGGTSSLKPMEPPAGDPLGRALQDNVEWMDASGIPATPFFFWRTAEGVQVSAGVPAADAFSAAMPD
jgi:hypothetical protein